MIACNPCSTNLRRDLPCVFSPNLLPKFSARNVERSLQSKVKKMNGTYQVNQNWKQLASRIVRTQQLVLVIGSTDTGKSTFCRFLIDVAVTEGFRVAFVDADIGQSQIGPPTTIGVKFFEPTHEGITSSEVPSVQFDGVADRIYFVGAVSPSRNQLQVLTGTRLMVDVARQAQVDFIVVDTTGYIRDNAAVVLKQHKIELLRPNHLVCIGRSTEFEQITACYGQQEWLKIHYLRPHRNVRSKSSEARWRHRDSQFNAYFGAAREPKLAIQKSESLVQQVPFEQIRGGRAPFFIGRVANEKELEILTRLTESEVHYAEWGHRTLSLITEERLSNISITYLKNYLSLMRVTAEVRSYFERRLVGLINPTGETFAVGVIEAVDFKKRELSIRCPSSMADDVAKHACALQFGDYQFFDMPCGEFRKPDRVTDTR